MKSSKVKKIVKIVLIVLLIAAIVAIIFWLSVKQLPVRVLTEYSFSTLWEESTTMHECAECHDETETDFHTCSTCHDEHGSVEFPDLSFYTMVEVTGDVEEVIYIPTNHFFSYSDLPNTFLTVDEFMEKWEISNYASITIYTRDGEFVSIDKENITENAKFLPYEDGIRFASDDLHVSTWAKGIAKIIIVSAETPLQIEDEKTSIGRLLLGKTTSITIEEAKVMFVSEEDGLIREAITSSRVEGAALADLLDLEDYEEITFTQQDGTTVILPAEEVADAVLTKQRSSVVLILPEKGRSDWVSDIIKIEGN